MSDTLFDKAHTLKRERASLKKIPTTPGVYGFSDESGEIIYIGKAKNLKSRLTSYFSKDLLSKTAKMVHESRAISFVEVGSELEALLLEARLVRKHQPKYNSELRDDKHPLYIAITRDLYPQVITTRKIAPEDRSLYSAYFGPFPSSTAVKSVLRLLRRVFPYATHKLGKRACIYSQIGLCKPCPNYIESLPESERVPLQKEYARNIRLIRNILRGKISDVAGVLQNKMESYSQNEQFEEAQRVKNQIDRLTYITQSPTSIEAYIQNPNFIDDMRQFETASLKAILVQMGVSLPRLRRIECFDIAHIAGSNPTASMVVFVDAVSDTSQYRHFRIRQKNSRSDTDSLREALTRRLNHFSDWGKPDLIIVDGGKPQVSVFVDVLSGTGIPIIGIAKRYETLIIPRVQNSVQGSKKEYLDYRLPKGPAKYLVQRMRDEAHRFSRRYHHTLLKKDLLATGE